MRQAKALSLRDAKNILQNSRTSDRAEVKIFPFPTVMEKKNPNSKKIHSLS